MEGMYSWGESIKQLTASVKRTTSCSASPSIQKELFYPKHSSNIFQNKPCEDLGHLQEVWATAHMDQFLKFLREISFLMAMIISFID